MSSDSLWDISLIGTMDFWELIRAYWAIQYFLSDAVNEVSKKGIENITTNCLHNLPVFLWFLESSLLWLIFCDYFIYIFTLYY